MPHGRQRPCAEACRLFRGIFRPAVPAPDRSSEEVQPRILRIRPPADAAGVQNGSKSSQSHQPQLESRLDKAAVPLPFAQAVESLQAQCQDGRIRRVLVRGRFHQLGKIGAEGQAFQILSQSLEHLDGRRFRHRPPVPAPRKGHVGEREELGPGRQFASSASGSLGGHRQLSRIRGQDRQDLARLPVNGLTQDEAARIQIHGGPSFRLPISPPGTRSFSAGCRCPSSFP